MKFKIMNLSMLVLVAYLTINLVGQEVNLEVLKNEWKSIPVFALKKNGAPITNLKKKDIELLVNGQNTRNFLVQSRPLNAQSPSKMNEALKISSKQNDITITLFFDNQNTDQSFHQNSITIARRIVRQSSPDIFFRVMTAGGLNKGPEKDKHSIINWLKKDSKPINTRTSTGFKSLYQWSKKSKDTKIVYIFQKQNKTATKTIANATAYIEQLDALVYLINPTDGITTIPPGTYNGHTMTGNTQKIIKSIQSLHQSYHEILVPAQSEFAIGNRAVSLLPLREHVSFYTQNGIATTSSRDSSPKEIEPSKTLSKQIKQEKSGQPVEVPTKVLVNSYEQKGVKKLQHKIERFLKKGDVDSTLKFLLAIIEKGLESTDYNEKVIEQISAIDSKSAENFVVAHNNSFTPEFRKKFYKLYLMDKGVESSLLNLPVFGDVIIFAQKIKKNQRGFWEGTFLNNTSMIFIPGGKFPMGLPWESGGAQDESPLHWVHLDGYWIAKFETTFRQFDNYCLALAKKRPDDKKFGRNRRPVINVSWLDATDYCQWLSEKTGLAFRMPTEAQWEKAARGTGGSLYPWGDPKPSGDKANFADSNLYDTFRENNPGADKIKSASWIDRKSDDRYIYTSPVGKYPAGASHYGVMDMAGNVWEFVFDWYDGDYYRKSPSQNPRGPSYDTSFKVIRGGGWDSHHWMVRTTTRAAGVPDKGSDALGFRVSVSAIGMPEQTE